MFKSFTPKKYSRSKRYRQWLVSKNISIRKCLELCANCGYPWGQHHGSMTCPQGKEHLHPDVKFLKPIKCVAEADH